MSDFDLTEFFLTAMLNYGPAALGLTLLVGALGAPMPGTLFVIAAGAFVRQGALEWPAAFGAALGGAVVGDSLSYGMGRFAGGWAERRFGQGAIWQKARAAFERQGGLAVYLTRFFLTPIAVPVNLIAGGGGYSFGHFLAYDAAGELTWIVLYGTLGYAFGSQWELISDFVNDFSGLLVGLVLVGAGLYYIATVSKAT
jgi:membrane protein DedA with SNARE-associated domain